MILAIDPGTMISGWVVYEPHDKAHPIRSHGIGCNQTVLHKLRSGQFAGGKRSGCEFAIETIQSYGMPMGASTIETIVWIGRFIEACCATYYFQPIRIPRPTIKTHLCGTPRAKDANVNAALFNRWGGDRRKAIGIKKHPGPLYGLKAHSLAALAVAVTYDETRAIRKHADRNEA